MGSLLLKYMAHFLMCRKLVSGTCRKLASYKSAGKFPTKHNRGLSSGCFCCLQSTFNVYVDYVMFMLRMSNLEVMSFCFVGVFMYTATGA